MLGCLAGTVFGGSAGDRVRLLSGSGDKGVVTGFERDGPIRRPGGKVRGGSVKRAEDCAASREGLKAERVFGRWARGL